MPWPWHFRLRLRPSRLDFGALSHERESAVRYKLVAPFKVPALNPEMKGTTEVGMVSSECIGMEM